MIFVAHGAGAKAFGRASTTQAPTTHRNAPKSSDNDTPSPLARSSEMNRPMAARPRDVSGCTFLHDLTGRSERQVKFSKDHECLPFFPSDDTPYRT